MGLMPESYQTIVYKVGDGVDAASCQSGDSVAGYDNVTCVDDEIAERRSVERDDC